MPFRRRLPLLAAAALVAASCAASVPLAVSATTPESTTPTTPTTPVNPLPPKATTSGPTSLSRTGATLNGSILPGGAATTYRFEYGTTTSYGLTTPESTLPAGTSSVAVERAISGLTVSTTYHYRLVATNAAGESRGSDRTLKTLANPRSPSVSTQGATGVGADGATLTARVNPQGQATTYSFQYGTSTKYGGKTASVSVGAGTSTVTVSTPVSGLKANTKYSYRVVAVNPTGTVRGSNRTFTTTRGLTGVAIAAPRTTVTWNESAVINGTVGGLSAGGVKVSLLRQDFPFTGGFATVATQTTSSAGAYSFTVGPLWWAARFQVSTQTTPPVVSSTVHLNNRLFAKLRAVRKKATSVQLRGQFYPAVPQGRVSVQRKTPKGRWVRVASPKLTHDTVKNRSSYRATVSRLSGRSARYRVVITPNDAGAHLKTTTKTIAVARRR